MGGAEGVHYVNITQGGILLRQRLVVFFLTFIEADVFEQHHFAVGYLDTVQVVLDQANFLTQHSGQVLGHRLHGGGLVVNAFFRTAQVGHQHDFRSGIPRRLDGGQ